MFAVGYVYALPNSDQLADAPAGVTLTILSLSAQSGYSSSLNLHYASNVKGEVCGTNPKGPLYSSQVEADTL